MGLNLETLKKDFSPELRDASTWLRAADGTVTVDCPPDQLLALCDYLHSRAKPAFTQMISITGTDESIPGESEPDRVALRSGAKERFRVVYHAAAIAEGKRQLLRIVCWVPDGASLPSVTRFWIGADWMERETYDMFGIPFEGHPDLKRILMPDGYDGYPLRKDFPLRGREPDRLYRQWDREREA